MILRPLLAALALTGCASEDAPIECRAAATGDCIAAYPRCLWLELPEGAACYQSCDGGCAAGELCETVQPVAPATAEPQDVCTPAPP